MREFPADFDPNSIALSAQQITSCSTEAFGCSGGWTDVAFEYIKSAGGLVSEATYPYTSGITGATGSCSSAVTSARKLVSLSSYSRLSGESSIVMNTGPVVVYVDGSTWSTYSSGIMTVSSCPNTNSVNHAG